VVSFTLRSLYPEKEPGAIPLRHPGLSMTIFLENLHLNLILKTVTRFENFAVVNNEVVLIWVMMQCVETIIA
jgi:hypothetical protein